MIRYLKITLVDGSRFILRVTGETRRLVRGIEVDRHGDEVVPPGFDNRLRVIERSLIKKAVELRMNNTYATLEVASSSANKPAHQLDDEIAASIDHATRKQMPSAVRTAIQTGALSFIAGMYRHHASAGGKEPCLTVGLITDYLRQASMPEDFRFATKDRQRVWTRSVLETMRSRGLIGSSFGERARCYEPKR